MLEKKILEDYKKAMKDKDAVRVSTLSFLRSELKNVSIDKKKEGLDDVEALTVIKKQVKQHQDSIEQFNAGGRQDLVQKENLELKILLAYLPQLLSEDKIKEAISEVIAATQAKGPQDMGRVMKELLPKLAGQADNKLVSDLVKQALIKPE